MTTLTSNLKEALSTHLSTPIKSIRAVSGGDISLAFHAQSHRGECFFVKTHPNPPSHFFEAEALGLVELKKTKTLRVPEVRTLISEAGLEALVLEWIEPGRAQSHTSENFGRELASLHQSPAPYFGLASDNYIGTLEQSNTRSTDWREFFIHQRVMPQIKLAEENGYLTSLVRTRTEAFIARLPDLLGAPEPPSPLHGDLWAGNRLVDISGYSWLIDPAFYFGNREVDLGMMKLFGGFDRVVFDTYNETYPLQPGWQERIELYQLYPMLVHLNLFGASYLSSVSRILNRYL